MAGEFFEVRDGDRVWRVGRPDGTARKAMVAAVAQLAWAEVAELQPVAPAAYAEAKDAYFRAVSGGDHKPGGALWHKLTTGPQADALYLLGLLRGHHPDAALTDAQTLLANQPDAAAAAIVSMMPSFFDALAADPETPAHHRPRFAAAAAAMRAAGTTPPTPSSSTTPPGSA